MSENLLALLMTAGILLGLAVWVPALNFVQRLVNSKRTPFVFSSAQRQQARLRKVHRSSSD